MGRQRRTAQKKGGYPEIRIAAASFTLTNCMKLETEISFLFIRVNANLLRMFEEKLPFLKKVQFSRFQNAHQIKQLGKP